MSQRIVLAAVLCYGSTPCGVEHVAKRQGQFVFITTFFLFHEKKFFIFFKMLNGYRILLLVVILIGLVLIYGYQYLTFGAASNRSSHTAVPNSETLVPILLPLGIKSRTSSVKLSPELSKDYIISSIDGSGIQKTRVSGFGSAVEKWV